MIKYEKCIHIKFSRMRIKYLTVIYFFMNVFFSVPLTQQRVQSLKMYCAYFLTKKLQIFNLIINLIYLIN